MRRKNFPGVLKLTVIILIGLSGIYSAAGAEPITVHMERGQQYYQSGDYEAALKEFRAATEIDPGYIKGWENMSWTYWKMGKTDQAIEIWESLKAVHTDLPGLLNMIANAYTAKGQYEEALATYEESLLAKPGQVEVFAAKCRVLHWAGRNEDAYELCREFLSNHPEQDEIRQLLAKLQMSQEIGNYQAAISNWQNLIQKRPEDLQLRIELAKAYYRSESYFEAFETTKGIYELDSGNVTALQIMINAAIRMQQYELAQDAVKKFRDANPDNSEIDALQARIHDGIAREFYQQGDYNSALKEFLLAETLVPDLPRLQENIGWTYRHLGRIDEAVKIWKQLLDSRPDDVRILNLLARAYTAERMYEKALVMYDKSLEIEPSQKDARFARAKILRWIGNFQESADELTQLVEEYPENAPMRYQLTRCLVRLQKYDEAIRHFIKLTSERPDDSQYRMGMARVLYLNEQYQEALKIANDVIAKDPCNLNALDFLVDDAEFLGDFDRACGLLDSAIAVDGNNIPRLNRLALFAAANGDYPVVEQVTEKSLGLLESQPEIRMLYADSLRMNGRVDKAVKQYQQVLKYNPNHIPALNGLKECYLLRKDYRKCLEYLERILSIDKTNFYLTLEKSRLLAYEGDYNKSIKLLEDLLDSVTTNEAVLVLLYHGLTQNERSSILKFTNFKAQMEVLSELGYSAVTVEDLINAWKGEKKLPNKAVLITFDDGRRDSFECAAPVLKDLSFKATMFVPVCVVNSTDPFFCSWQQLEHYSGTGLWDIQSHGNNAHRDIVINAAGERGTFLTHRQWFDDGKRIENDSEYHRRVDSDYKESKEILEKHLNKKINAFAFPKGKFGQEEYAYIDSVASNLTSVSNYYTLGFVQNKYGFNFIGDNPFLLKRLEVDETWTAQQLRDHITMNNPVRLARLNLANVYRWSGETNHAIRIYDQMLKDNQLDKDILLGKAIACTSSGRFMEARTILDQVLEQDGTNQIAAEQRERVEWLTASTVEPFISYFKDENGRRRIKWGASLHLPYNENLTIESSWARAKLEQKNFNKVNENEYLLSAIYRLGDARYDLSYIFRDFFGADNEHNYSVTAGMPLFFDNVTLTHAYRSEETARAAIQGIQYYENSISLRHAVNGRLTAYFWSRRNDYSDNNWRNSVKLTGLYRFLNLPKLYAGCELVYDDSNFFSPVYYTPDEVRMVGAVFKVTDRVFDDVNYNLRYAVGHAQERGNDDKIVQNGSMSLNYQVSDSLELGLLFTFSDTPTYGSEYININLKYRF